MKNLISLLLAVAVGVVLLPACELTQVLNEEPPNNLTPENVVDDEQSAQELLNGVYASLHDQYYSLFSELNPGLLSGSMADNGFLADDEFANNSIAIENGNVENTWQAYYSTMDAANVLIDIVSELPESVFTGNRKQEMLAEAHYMRAMALFDALRYFGVFWDTNSELGVIVRTVPVDFTTRNKARSTVEECYTQIIADLDFAIANAPDFTVPYRASKTSGRALKAKALLFMGQYEEAAQLANEVIQDNSRQLSPTFSEVFEFNADFSNTDEMIFMRYTDEVTEANNERKRFIYGGNSYAIAGEWLKTLMSGDPRQQSTYNADDDVLIKVNNAEAHYPTYFMRLAQVYLIKAEGLARSGVPLDEAKEPLETIRSRALGTEYESTATTRDELLDEIFNEIALELAFENGSEWFAAIRFDKIIDLKPQVTSEDQFILPVPQSELEANPQFGEQNPGYNN